MPNQPQGFAFSTVNKKNIETVGTCYLVYKLPGHLIPFTGCCACINCDLCRLTSIKKDYAATVTGADIQQRPRHVSLDLIEPNYILENIVRLNNKIM